VTDEKPLDAVKFGPLVSVSPEMVADIAPLGFGFVLDQPLYGPLRSWDFEPVDDSYLDDLAYDDLLAEAKRLHGLAQEAVQTEAWQADNPGDVEALVGVFRAVWRHRAGHPPLLDRWPTPEESL
jgi:hypothetical protein